MPEPDYFVKTGDSASSIYTTLLDANGDAVDIASASIRFKMKPISGGTLALAVNATNAQNGAGTVDGSTGNVAYAWAAAGTTGAVPGTAGWYLGEWEVTYSNGSVESFPNGNNYMLIDVGEGL